jgi:uncharacterized protein YkwD
MLTLRRIAPLFAVGLLAACGTPLEEALPQNEAQENAPQGIVFLDEDTPLPPDFVIQALTAAEQTTMLNAVNATRKVGAKCGTTSYGAATALKPNAKLVTAAENHAADMARYNYFSHTGRDGSNPGTRITRAAYSWSTYGENIAAGYATIADAVKGWYASEGHCKNFMNKNLVEAGFGKGYNSTSMWKTYWVAVLARPK